MNCRRSPQPAPGFNRSRAVTVSLGWFLAFAALAQPRWDAPPAEQTRGVFWRGHPYLRGLTNGNPGYDRRFRVNAREVVLHPQFGRRVEARENGLMLIRAEEDLFQLAAAELHLELWGGHPGTARKRVTINGRSTYALPAVGTEENHCSYSHPHLPLRLTDLVNGWNAFQFALDQGRSFWGHAIVDRAWLYVALTNNHPDLRAAGLADFPARVLAEPRAGDQEGFSLRLEGADAWLARLAAVDFQGWFDGYDENGDTRATDWHGFTKHGQPQGHLGTVRQPPFALTWDTRLLPAQSNVAVRAAVRFHAPSNLVFVTPATAGLVITHPERVRVSRVSARELPTPFWSRAGQGRQCVLELPMAAEQLEAAELHVNAWTGGPGTVRDYFTLNGRAFPVAEGAGHELAYSRLAVDPKLLRRGANRVELLSNTEHHGIEILRPGPTLMVRWRPGP